MACRRNVTTLVTHTRTHTTLCTGIVPGFQNLHKADLTSTESPSGVQGDGFDFYVDGARYLPGA
eukprot:3761344-Rhodomonas_salina.2